MAEAFVGLDLGTTGIKAVAFDGDDRELAKAVLPTPTHQLPNGGGEYEADELWDTACLVLRGVNEQLSAEGHTAVAVATASMGEAGVLLDGSGAPVSRVIAWFDPRTERQAQWWIDHVGAERTHRIAGLPPRPVFGAAKMLWTKQHLSEKWNAGRHWLNMADWAAYRLAGTMATDFSLASRTMLFDLAARQWSAELVEASGLDAALLAPLVQSGTPVGSVTVAASAATGLPVGTTVGAGGQDHVCAALALGITEPGMMLDSIGTAEAFFLVTHRVDTSGRIAASGIGQGAHVEPGRNYAMTGLGSGGGRIDARRQELGLGWDEFLTTPEAAAVINEVARDGNERVDAIMEATGIGEIRHLVTGGGSRNADLIARKVEVGGRPIDVASETEATALGAARLAQRAWSEAS